jgi:hypothetical protein
LLVVRAAKADEVLAHLDGVGAERLLVRVRDRVRVTG